MLYIKKSGERWRFYIDYQKFNIHIKIDLYPLFLIDKVFNKLVTIQLDSDHHMTSHDCQFNYITIQLSHHPHP